MDGQNGFLARQDASWTCLFDRHPNQLKAGAFVAVTGGLFSDALAELFRKAIFIENISRYRGVTHLYGDFAQD
ncbi:hypothetical protein NKJ93_20950 [Mesorhizobium sp. M0028]|uniref:hypothetical protein n=1 Tax=Mesorhizobium sp. M0028 TaxID=2956849 RepID=UPI00333E05CA